MIVEHLTYSAIDESYGIDIFTQEKDRRDFSKAVKTNLHIYDYVFTDSENERNFVKELDTGTDIEVYSKLPKSFSIPTPVGNYNPDWAIAFKQGISEAHLLHRRNQGIDVVDGVARDREVQDRMRQKVLHEDHVGSSEIRRGDELQQADGTRPVAPH